MIKSNIITIHTLTDNSQVIITQIFTKQIFIKKTRDPALEN